MNIPIFPIFVLILLAIISVSAHQFKINKDLAYRIANDKNCILVSSQVYNSLLNSSTYIYKCGNLRYELDFDINEYLEN